MIPPVYIQDIAAPDSQLGAWLQAVGALAVFLFAQAGVLFLFGMGAVYTVHPESLSEDEQSKAMMAIVVGAFFATVFPICTWQFLVKNPIEFAWNFRKHRCD